MNKYHGIQKKSADSSIEGTLANKQLTDHLVLTRGRNLIFDQEANDGYLFEEANTLSYSIGNITM